MTRRTRYGHVPDVSGRHSAWRDVSLQADRSIHGPHVAPSGATPRYANGVLRGRLLSELAAAQRDGDVLAVARIGFVWTRSMSPHFAE